MDQSRKFSHATPVPNWRDPVEARRDIHRIIDAFVTECLACGLPAGPDIAPSEPAPKLALRVSAGLGKTTAMLRVLAGRGSELLARGHVVIYCPTLDLAERAAAEFATLNSGLAYTVVRGRNARNPETGKTMCERAEFADGISRVVRSVTQAICRGRGEDGKISLAPCAQNCAYIAQLDWQGAGPHRILFAAHSYLVTGLPIKGAIALAVIDERCWPTLVASSSLGVDAWMAPPPPGLPHALQHRHGIVRATVLIALQEDKPIFAALRDQGIDADTLRQLSAFEYEAVPHLVLYPGITKQVQETRALRFDRAAFQRGRRRGRIFDLLAEAADRETTERLSLGRRLEGGAIQDVIMIHCIHPLPTDLPFLMLDADADAEILSAIAPGAVMARIDAKPEAEVVQISDLTLSNSWLLDPKSGVERRSRVARVIDREAAAAGDGGALLVATKDVLEELHRGAGLEAADDASRAPKPSLHGAEPRWFGPRMLGVNDYKDHRTIILVGRLQPPVETIEENMRALFGDSGEPLKFAEAGRLVRTARPRLMVDGKLVDAVAQVHPDQRGMAILEQLRERMTLQAIARLRLIAPRSPKRVVLLCNMPLPDLPVTRLAKLDVLADDLENEPFPEHRRRLTAALDRRGRPGVAGLRLSARGLAEDLPATFDTEGRAREFRRGLKTEDLVGILFRIADELSWPCTSLGLKRRYETGKKKGGTSTTAVVFAESRAAIIAANRLWESFDPSPG